MALFDITLQRTQYRDVMISGECPEEALGLARALAAADPSPDKWEDTTAVPECVTLRVRCPHNRVTQNHDPEGIADCLDCHGDDWLDVEVPE